MDLGHSCYLPIIPTEMKIFERKKELDWLNQVSSWSNLVALSGLKGTGKMTLIRHWLFLKGTKCKWLSVKRFGKLPEILGTPGYSFEKSLDLFAGNWDLSETIVWRDFHNLSIDEQTRLVYFLKIQTSAPMQIFLSEESLDAFRTEVPILHLAPMSESEIGNYLRDFLNVKTPFDTQQVLKITGGLPFLINLWVQSPGHIDSIRQTALDSMSSAEKQALFIILLLPLGLRKPTELPEHKSSDPIPRETLLNLERKLYLTLENGFYKVEPSLIDILSSSMSPLTTQTTAQICFDYEASQQHLDGFSLWVLALQTANLKLIEQTAFAFDPKHLEGIQEKDLKFLDRLMEDLGLFEKIKLESSFFCRMMRLHLLVLILIGKRSLAVERGLQLSKLLAESEQTDSEAQWLAYELVHWCQRSGQFETITNLLLKASAKTSDELRLLFQLELSFPYIQKEPARALKTLNRLIEEMTPPKNDKQKLVLANAYFQKGRASAVENSMQAALESYQKAGEIYRQIDQIYYSLLSRLNQIWVVLESRDINEFEKLIPEIEQQSRRYGFRYIRAGVLLSQAVIERWQLRLGSAFEKIQQALDLIPPSAPPKAKTDALYEKILVLSSLGLFQEAHKTLREIESEEVRQGFELEAQLVDLPLEEVIEKWQKLKFSKDSESFWIYLLQRGQRDKFIVVDNLRKTKNGQWALLEFEFTERLRSLQSDLYLPLVGQMEQLLANVNEILPERVALSCLQASLAESSAAKLKWLERAELELKRWGGEVLAKNPFTAWLQSLRTEGRLSDNPLWKQSRIQDLERWDRWVPQGSQAEKAGFEMITNEGKKDLTELPQNLPNAQLILIEHLGQVFYKKKELLTFHRKSILRQILALFFEVYPQGLSKSNLATAVWGESYSPSVHDSRIYTSIQRLRKLIHDESIEAWDGGYRWNPKTAFCYLKSNISKDLGQHKIQTLLIQALKNFKKNGQIWASRSDLLEATGSSESTVKRELSKLLTKGLIVRKGQGPSVVYSSV